MHNLAFRQLLEYDAGRTGITVPVTLRLIGKKVEFEAKIDTGSTNCIFARQIGEELGLDIEQGLPKRIGTATGSFLISGKVANGDKQYSVGYSERE